MSTTWYYMFTFTLLAETLTFISIQAGKPREANSA